MLKKLGSLLTLSSLLLTTTAFARNPVCTEAESLLRDRQERASAELHCTLRPGSLEYQWSRNYEISGKRDIVRYVRDIASDRPQEALWWIMAGGPTGIPSGARYPR